MRSNWSVRPSDSWSESAIFPRSSSFVKMPSVGGHVPRQTVAPASASALAIAKPNPPSSDTPATKARLPFRSIASIADPSPADGRAGPGEPRAERGEDRSEEHTSELQSLAYLVCRLLLEKKKKYNQ